MILLLFIVYLSVNYNDRFFSNYIFITDTNAANDREFADNADDD